MDSAALWRERLVVAYPASAYDLLGIDRNQPLLLFPALGQFFVVWWIHPDSRLTILFPSAIISHRPSECFKVVEIALFPVLISASMQLAKHLGARVVFTNSIVLACLLTAVLSVEILKNIDAEMRQRNYSGTIFDCQYISVFDR